jgi:predicted dehydrogenase
MNIAVIGLGYWGPNILRNISKFNYKLKYICDLDKQLLDKFSKIYKCTPTQNYKTIINDNEIDIVFIITPMNTHYFLAKECLLKKKHIWVEKPLCKTYEEACELRTLAEENGVRMFCDHTYIYHPCVNYLKKQFEKNNYKILNIKSERINLGLFKNDHNVIWDLAPHDLSIILYLLEKNPIDIKVNSFKVLKLSQECTSNIILIYDDFQCNINLSWLSPVKKREFSIITDKNMFLWNDIDIEKIKIFNKGISINENDKNDLLISYFNGDIYIPEIKNINQESLYFAMKDFFECIISNQEFKCNMDITLNVIKFLEKINKLSN